MTLLLLASIVVIGVMRFIKTCALQLGPSHLTVHALRLYEFGAFDHTCVRPAATVDFLRCLSTCTGKQHPWTKSCSCVLSARAPRC